MLDEEAAAVEACAALERPDHEMLYNHLVTRTKKKGQEVISRERSSTQSRREAPPCQQSQQLLSERRMR